MFKRLVFASIILFLPCLAQETAEITGRIVDSSNSVVAGVSVDIRDVNTNAQWDVRTNADGYYTKALLPPSEYKITVHMPGIQAEIRTITLEVQQVARIDFKLQVGAGTETMRCLRPPHAGEQQRVGRAGDRDAGH